MTTATKERAKGSKRGKAPRTKTMKGGDAIDKMKYTGRVPEVHTDTPNGINAVQTLSGVRLVVDEHVNMTPRFALEYIESPAIDMERNVSDNHVQLLFDQMRLGRFNWDVVQIVTAQLGDKRYKINGQHTSWAAYYLAEEAGVKPGKVLGRIRRMHYRVNDQESLSALYQTFDPSKGSRSVAHVNAMSLQYLSGFEGFSQPKLNRIGSGTAMWEVESDKARKRLDSSQVAVMVQKHLDVVHRVLGIWAELESFKPARRNCVFAAAMATFDKRPVAAKEFWVPVLTAVGFDDRNDPRLRLRNLLVDSVVRSKSKDKVNYTAEQLYRIMLYCWNKWRDGEPLRTTPRIPDSRLPIRG